MSGASDRQLGGLLLTRRNPNGIHIDGLELTPLGASTPTGAGGDDDFFSSWDKEKPKASASTVPKTATPPPSIGLAKPAATGPRTVTSSALRSGTGGASAAGRPAATSRLSSTSTTASASASASGAPGGKLSKLGAKKATTSINFEEAQRKALEEEERIKRLGYDKLKEEEEARKIKEREAEERRKAKSAIGSSAGSGADLSRSSTPANGAARGVDDAPKPARLGFGQVVGAPAQPVVKT